MNKFNDQDLVTVVEDEPSLWYTHMDTIRKERQGRTGRVMKIESQVLNKEDWESHLLGRDPKLLNAISDDYEMTEYSYLVRFTDCEEIVFTEAHLKLFVMSRLTWT